MTERVFLDATSGNTCDWYGCVVVGEGVSDVARGGASDVEISLVIGEVEASSRVAVESSSSHFRVGLP